MLWRLKPKDSISNGLRSVAMDVMRIFSPSDHAYPIIGVQQFTGELYKGKTANSW